MKRRKRIIYAMTILCVSLGLVFAAGTQESGGGTGSTKPAAAGTGERDILTVAEVMEMYDQMSFATMEEYTKATGKSIKVTGQAPSLKALESSGQIPSLAERVGPEPMVVRPKQEVGTYGGTWRLVSIGGGNRGHCMQYTRYGGLVRNSYDLNTVIPDMAKSFKQSADGKEYTFTLRKGVKWSDGESYGMDDIKFYWEDVLNNAELTPSFPGWLKSGGEPGEFVQVDDYTFKIVFKDAYPTFLTRMASPNARLFLLSPAHYLKQFHPAYTAKADLDAKVKEMEFDDWIQLFNDRWDFWINTDLPTVAAWKVVVPYGDSDRIVLERNPYFWKIDTEGNQLPYIDKVTVAIVSDAEIMTMKVLSGEVDFSGPPVGENISELPLYLENQEKGGYIVGKSSPPAHAIYLTFNQNHQDPVKRQILTDARFRFAMSYAIDREEIIELVFMGQSEPSQIAPLRGRADFHEELWSTAIEYDPDLANQLLDEMGLDKKDSEGYRLGPDGKRVSFTIITYPAVKSWEDTGVIIAQKYWKAVGIDAAVKVLDRTLWSETWQSAQHDINITNTSLGMGIDSNHRWVPIAKGWGTAYGSLWADWYMTDGAEGEEPPAEVKEMISVWEQIEVTVDRQKRLELFETILDWRAETLFGIGICPRPPMLIPIKNNFYNVPNEFLQSWSHGIFGPMNPSQFFIKE